VLILLQITDPQLDRSPRREQQQGNIHIHDRDHHLPAAHVHFGGHGHEHSRYKTDAARAMVVLCCRCSIHYFGADCLPLHRAVQVQAPTPLPDYCLLAFSILPKPSG
jgi:hypothetical protein